MARTRAGKRAPRRKHSMSWPAHAGHPGGIAKTAPKPVPKRRFKYPAEDECLVRRLGSRVPGIWAQLPPGIRVKSLEEANLAWDREYGIGKLPQKLDAFVRRHPSRLD